MKAAPVKLQAERNVVVASREGPAIPETEAAVAGRIIAEHSVYARPTFHALKDVVFVEGGRRKPSRDPVAREIEDRAVGDGKSENF